MKKPYRHRPCRAPRAPRASGCAAVVPAPNVEKLEQRRLLAASVAMELYVGAAGVPVVDNSAGDQHHPVIAFNSGIGVVVWVDDSAPGGSGDDVVARMFGASGNWIGPAFIVNITRAGNQVNPQVAVSDSGEFVITWLDQSVANNAIRMRQFDFDGGSKSGEVTVNTNSGAPKSNPRIAMAGNAGYVIAWDSDGQDGSGLGIYAQRYEGSWRPVGVEFAINTTTSGDQSVGNVAMDDLGNFVVAWTSADNAGDGVYIQRFNSAGTMIGIETLVNTTQAGDQNAPSIGLNRNGGEFVVAWTSDGQDGAGTGVYFQRFDQHGAAQALETQGNSTTSGNQDLASITMSDAGSFVISFIDASTGTNRAIVRCFDSNGAPMTAETAIVSGILGTAQPQVAIVSDGRFATATASSNGADDDVSLTWFSGRLNVAADPGGSVISIAESFGDVVVTADGIDIVLPPSFDSIVINGSSFADSITLATLAMDIRSIEINAGAGNDTVNGSNFAEKIDGGAGNDVINSLGGNDTIIGGAGHDTINAGAGNDQVDPGTGNDEVNGGAGIDTVTYATRTADVLIRLNNLTSGQIGESDILSNFENAIGGSGSDLIIGNVGSNMLSGGDGDDTLEGMHGDDTIIGGAGIDTVSYESHWDAVHITFDGIANDGAMNETDTMIGVENATGGKGNDTIIGDAGDNVLIGGEGNDWLDGRGGADVLSGGEGIDTVDYRSRTAGVRVTIDLIADDGEVGEGDIVDLTVENVVGGSGNDYIVGSNADNDLRGFAGDDTIYGLGGHDIIFGYGGRDRIDGGDGNDTIDAGDGPDIIYAGPGNDSVFGNVGRDRIFGGEGNDRIKGGSGHDTIIGENGRDTIYGDAGNDSLEGGNHDDYLFGGSGHDTLLGGAGADKMHGETGNDFLNGGRDGDRMDGGSGTDSAYRDELDRLFGIEVIL